LKKESAAIEEEKKRSEAKVDAATKSASDLDLRLAQNAKTRRACRCGVGGAPREKRAAERAIAATKEEEKAIRSGMPG